MPMEVHAVAPPLGWAGAFAHVAWGSYVSSGRYSLLMPLPLHYNPDKHGKRAPVEHEKFEQTAREITEHFRSGGALHLREEGKVKGFWWDQGIVHDDVLALLEIDLEDTAANRAWLRRYARDVLLARFRQRAIYLKFVGPVETLLVREDVIALQVTDEEVG